MPIGSIVQPWEIVIDEKLRLRQYRFSEWSIALPWYQDRELVDNCDGKEASLYDMDKLNRMYSFLSIMGELYFIEMQYGDKWVPVGDVTLSEENMPIVIARDYWGHGIGKRAISCLIERARQIGLQKIFVPAIYHYNDRSKNLFTSMGFKKVSENEKEASYELVL